MLFNDMEKLFSVQTGGHCFPKLSHIKQTVIQNLIGKHAILFPDIFDFLPIHIINEGGVGYGKLVCLPHIGICSCMIIQTFIKLCCFFKNMPLMTKQLVHVSQQMLVILLSLFIILLIHVVAC